MQNQLKQPTSEQPPETTPKDKDNTGGDIENAALNGLEGGGNLQSATGVGGKCLKYIPESPFLEYDFDLHIMLHPDFYMSDFPHFGN